MKIKWYKYKRSGVRKSYVMFTKYAIFFLSNSCLSYIIIELKKWKAFRWISVKIKKKSVVFLSKDNKKMLSMKIFLFGNRNCKKKKKTPPHGHSFVVYDIYLSIPLSQLLNNIYIIFCKTRLNPPHLSKAKNIQNGLFTRREPNL